MSVAIDFPSRPCQTADWRNWLKVLSSSCYERSSACNCGYRIPRERQRRLENASINKVWLTPCHS